MGCTPNTIVSTATRNSGVPVRYVEVNSFFVDVNCIADQTFISPGISDNGPRFVALIEFILSDPFLLKKEQINQALAKAVRYNPAAVYLYARALNELSVDHGINTGLLTGGTYDY